VKYPKIQRKVRIFITLWLFEKDNFYSLNRPPRNPPCPPLQRGVGGDFDDE
jgi:hypothetical protein